MPDRLVAPVGSEILLKAGICGADGYLIANQRVDWSVARNGVGQFSEMGLRDPSQLLGWWEAPQKIDDWSATSTTAYVPISLNTNTPDPNDDVQIQRGESWITLTSAAEGTSIITAYAPAFSEFNQAAATIYWVDAQWIFPASTIVNMGRPHTLTTTVLRRTDGAPLAGWVVRYIVAGGASLGYAGGNTIEVPTDATGRASVEVSPTDPGGGTTNIAITIVRPQSAGPNALPRMELGGGAATITWSPAAVPAPVSPNPPVTPAPVSPPPSLPGPAPPPQLPPATQPPPALPSNTSQPSPYTPPPSQPTGRPRLEINLRAVSPDQVAVGEFIAYELTVINRGDSVARHIQILDRFDRGLRFPGGKPNEYTVKNTSMRDLQPNESDIVRLPFQVVDVGKQCHDVTVTADGADPATQHACVTGVQADLNVSITGPRSRIVGEIAEFNAVIKNVGAIAATHVEVVLRCDAALVPTSAEPGSEAQADGSIMLRIERLEPGEHRQFRMQAQCHGPSNNACTKAFVTADGGVNQAAQACVEILPALSEAAPGGTGTP